MFRNLLVLAVSCLSLWAVTAAAQTFGYRAAPTTDGTVSALKNGAAVAATSVPAPPAMAGSFSLTNQNGTPVTEAAFRNSYRLLTFGYTHCNNTCTPALAAMLQALRGLPAIQANRVLPVFVTLDPVRDTPPALKAFLAGDGDRIIGLTGSPGEIARLAQNYGVYYQQLENPETAIERALSPQDLAAYRRDPEYRQVGGEPYTIGHGQFIYLSGPDGQFLRLFSGDMPAETIGQGLAESIK